MMMRNLSILASAALVMVAAAWSAGAAEVSKYKIIELYNPCNESDNDARWGAAAEAECEQYLRGFTDALILTGAVGPDKGICLSRTGTTRSAGPTCIGSTSIMASARSRPPAASWRP